MEAKKIDFLVVLEFLWKWKYYIGGISLLIAILAFVFSSPTFITPLYTANAVFYPSSSMNPSRGLLSENVFSEHDFLSIGKGEEAEQLLQILKSEALANQIKDRFNLMEHYGINPNDRFANYKFSVKYHKYVKSRLTEYTSIRVSVSDVDPELAAAIANDIVEIMDTMRNSILKVRAMDGLRIVEEDYIQKKNYVQMLVDSMNAIAQMGVLDFQGQSDALSVAYGEAISRGNQHAIAAVEKRLDLLAKYGPTQKWLSGELEYELDQLVRLRAKYKQIQADANNMVPSKYVIDRAYVPERKSFPKRSIVVLLAFFVTFVFSTVVIAFIEHYKETTKA